MVVVEGGLILALHIVQRVLRRIKDVCAVCYIEPWHIWVAQVQSKRNVGGAGARGVLQGKVCGREILSADVVATGDCKFIVDQRGRKIVPRARLEAEDLLVRTANVMAVLRGARAVECDRRT